MAYQSLYRRFRPQRFSDVLGQDHVSNTLRNAVLTETVNHAYLFSGPRGCGKTTSARILAKALNCTDLQGGEPCEKCDSCVQVALGVSMDVIEMDAASNNGVDAMRDLVSRASLGTSGRRKVYIVDEVHMLSTAASNALLKTLEEPPDHVVFVLATTDPQKVLPTIRSRTQHFEFRLFPMDVLVGLLRSVATEAGLDVDDATIEAVARKGAGSARDALSALDQVIAAGGIEDSFDTSEIAVALGKRDAGELMIAVDRAVSRGRDPRQLARDLTETLREVFHVHMGVPRSLADDSLVRLLAPAAVTRALELLGEVLVVMRDAIEPRVLLETTLVRLVRPDLDTTPAAVLERLERMERMLANGVPVGTTPAMAPTTSGPDPIVLSPRTSPLATDTSLAPGTARAPSPSSSSSGSSGSTTSDSVPVPESHATPERASREPSGEHPSVTPSRPTLVSAAVSRPGLDDGGTSESSTSSLVEAGADSDSSPVPSAASPEPSRVLPPLSGVPAGNGLPSLKANASAANQGPVPARKSGAADAARARLSGAPEHQRVSAVPAPRSDPSQPNASQPNISRADNQYTDRSVGSAAVADEPADEPADLRSRVLSELERTNRKARTLLMAGRFLVEDGDALTYGVPNLMHLNRCTDFAADLVAATVAAIGRTVGVEIVVDPDGASPITDAEPLDDGASSPLARRGPHLRSVPTPAEEPLDQADGNEQVDQTPTPEEDIDLSDLTDATDAHAPTPAAAFIKAFPGAEIVPSSPGQ